MNVPQRIGLDFDGTIVDHHEHKLRLTRERGYTLTARQTNTNLMKGLMERPHYLSLQDELYADLTLAAPPVAGALEALAHLPGELYIVCARRPANTRFAMDWLERHGVLDVIPAARVFFCNSSADKRGYCERLGLTDFLDDKLGSLEAMPRSMRRFLFDEDGVSAGLNMEVSIETVGNWAEFVRRVSQA